MLDPLPILTCWRCNSPCDTQWADTTAYGDREVRLIPTECSCTNERCVGYYDRAACIPPSPQQLLDRGQRALDTIRGITLEALQ